MTWRPSHWTKRNRIWRSLRVAWLLIRTLFIIYRERRRVVRAHARGEYDVRPDVRALTRMLREFRCTAVALGGLLIKLGQFLSARADLLPPDALAELAALQDEVPPEPFSDIRGVLRKELGVPLAEVFAEIDPIPAGSASLGQVHRARLLDGRIVAVKVQRPGIAQIVRTDLSTLRFVLGLVRRLFPSADTMLDVRGVFREFSRMISEELDYQREGHNVERFAHLMAEEEDVIAPGVVWERTTHRVLTLEWVTGIKITNVAALDAAGVNRNALARRLVYLYLKQVLEAGFFHADPHPGNIFVKPGVAGPKFVFVDFGMMGAITPRMKMGLRSAFAGVMQQDARQIVRGLEVLGFLGEDANHDALEQAIGAMLTRFSTLPFGELREVDSGEVLGEIAPVLYDQPIRLPAQFAFLGRAAGMLLGLTTLLSPGFNAMEVVSPFASQFIKRGGVNGVLQLLGYDSAQDLTRQFARESVSLVRSLAALPRQLEHVLDHAEKGELRIIIESPSWTPGLRTRDGHKVPTNVWNRPVPAWVPLGVGVAFVIAFSMRRRNGRVE